VLFFDDFEGSLAAWTGPGGGAHHGVIVTDPLNPLNDVLSFTSLNAGGDIFTTAAFPAVPADYIFSFDYLGIAKSESVDDDLGGFAGLSQGLPGTHYWLAGTQDTYGGLSELLIDDGAWHHYTIYFTSPGGAPLHVMLEDFSGSNGVAGDAYFDNVKLEAVPEPATLLLLGSGLTGIALRRRRSR